MTHQRIRTGHWLWRRWRCSCGCRSWETCPDRLKQAADSRAAMLAWLTTEPMELTW